MAELATFQDAINAGFSVYPYIWKIDNTSLSTVSISSPPIPYPNHETVPYARVGNDYRYATKSPVYPDTVSPNNLGLHDSNWLNEYIKNTDFLSGTPSFRQSLSGNEIYTKYGIYPTPLTLGGYLTNEFVETTALILPKSVDDLYAAIYTENYYESNYEVDYDQPKILYSYPQYTYTTDIGGESLYKYADYGQNFSYTIRMYLTLVEYIDGPPYSGLSFINPGATFNYAYIDIAGSWNTSAYMGSSYIGWNWVYIEIYGSGMTQQSGNTNFHPIGNFNLTLHTNLGDKTVTFYIHPM